MENYKSKKVTLPVSACAFALQSFIGFLQKKEGQLKPRFPISHVRCSQPHQRDGYVSLTFSIKPRLCAQIKELEGRIDHVQSAARKAMRQAELEADQK
eukprot:5593712-Pyramimonas_sp.AAC.3